MSKKRSNRSGRSKKWSNNSSSLAWGRLAYWLQLILVVVVPFVLLRGFYDYVDLPRGILVQVAVILILLIWLLGTLSQEKLEFIRTPFDWPLLGLVLWAGLSLLWANNLYEGLEIWSQWGACLVLFFLTVNLVRSERDTSWLLRALLLAGALVAVLGVLQYLLEIDWVLQLRPPAATFANRNMAAQFMVMMIPLAGSAFLLSRKGVHVFFSVVAFGILCLFLFYTSTRSAWLAVAVEFLLFTLLLARDHLKGSLVPPIGGRKKQALALCLVVGFILVNLTPSGFQWQVGKAYNRIRAVLPGLEPPPHQDTDPATEFSVEGSSQSPPLQATGLQETTLTVRIHIWQNTLRMAQENLLGGVGVGNFGVFYPRYARSAVVDPVFDEDGQWQRAHNDYVQTFAELGVVGLFFLGWLLFALIKTSAALLNQPRRELRYLLMGVIVALSGLSVSAFFSFPFQMVTPTFVFAIYLGILGGHSSRQSMEDEKSGSPRRAVTVLPSWVATFGVTATVLFLLILLPFQYNRLRADWHFRKSEDAGLQGNWAAVISQANEGYQYYPHRKEFLFRIGKAYFETGELDAGIEATKEFLEAYPYFANAHHNIGMAYALKGDEKAAFRHFDTAFEIIPTYAKSHFAVAQLYELRSNLDEALEHYRSAVKGDSSNSQFLVALGDAALKKGLQQEAMDSFGKAVKKDPDNSAFYVKLGTAATSLQKFGEAKVAFSKAVELNPKSAEARYRLGMILYLAFNEREEGIRHFKQALNLNPPARYAEQMRQLIESDSP